MDNLDAQWDRLLEAVVVFQSSYGEAPLVGGTATALHVGHRQSNDADFEFTELRERFDELLEELEADERWKLKRRQFGQVITGRFDGVETGLRQLRRSEPLETASVETKSGPIVIPTRDEMIRIKGWLILDGGHVRDYLDFAALTHAAGETSTQNALHSLNVCYRDMDPRGGERGTDPLMPLQWQLDDPRPPDLEREPAST